MAKAPVQLSDLENYAQAHNLTLDQLASQVMYSLATGVPTDQMGFYGRCWRQTT